MMSKKTICVVLMFAILFMPGCSSSSSPTVRTAGTTAALAVMSLLMGSTPELVRPVFVATLITALVGVLVIHTILNVPSKVPSLAWTEIAYYGLVTVFLTAAILVTLFGQSHVQQNGDPVFPEGQGPDGFTVAANMPLQLAEGDYHIVHFSCEDTIPIVSADPTVIYQYAFVFDSDGNTANNYSPANNDFFKDTDKWYVMSYDDTAGWVLTVSTAFDGLVTEVASAARVIIRDNAMTLLVPASEFAVSDPAYRVTAFCHNGDFGINPPFDWSGDLHPPVADGLEPFPQQN